MKKQRCWFPLQNHLVLRLLRLVSIWLFNAWAINVGVFQLTMLSAPAQATPLEPATPALILPTPGLQPQQLAVVINTRDPLSWKIADYYQQQHHIPPRNLLHIAFDPGRSSLHPGEFAVLQKVLEAKTPATVQAYLLTWAQPYRVGCMSISSAFALGYDPGYCATGCKPTAINTYASSDSLNPYDDFGIRPTMLLAAGSFDQAKALIDRGVEARQWYFRGKPKTPVAYLVETPDNIRSVRKVYFADIKRQLGDRLNIHIERSEGIEGAEDVLFYFTGDRYVKGLDSNHYVPGAVADHLTSSGGQLTDSHQMSALAWLRAGVTGSYGTVVEPCAMLAKFPNPKRLMEQYLAGRTLLEAYWKSVLTPGQGVFVGDPLAAPFQGYRMVASAQHITVYTAQLLPGNYKLLAADFVHGPFRLITSGIDIGRGLQSFTLPPPYQPVYKLERLLSMSPLPLPYFLPDFK